jgi:hypothetical protein
VLAFIVDCLDTCVGIRSEDVMPFDRDVWVTVVICVIDTLMLLQRRYSHSIMQIPTVALSRYGCCVGSSRRRPTPASLIHAVADDSSHLSIPLSSVHVPGALAEQPVSLDSRLSTVFAGAVDCFTTRKGCGFTDMMETAGTRDLVIAHLNFCDRLVLAACNKKCARVVARYAPTKAVSTSRSRLRRREKPRIGAGLQHLEFKKGLQHLEFKKGLQHLGFKRDMKTTLTRLDCTIPGIEFVMPVHAELSLALFPLASLSCDIPYEKVTVGVGNAATFILMLYNSATPDVDVCCALATFVCAFLSEAPPSRFARGLLASVQIITRLIRGPFHHLAALSIDTPILSWTVLISWQLYFLIECMGPELVVALSHVPLPWTQVGFAGSQRADLFRGQSNPTTGFVRDPSHGVATYATYEMIKSTARTFQLRFTLAYVVNARELATMLWYIVSAMFAALSIWMMFALPCVAFIRMFGQGPFTREFARRLSNMKSLHLYIFCCLAIVYRLATKPTPVSRMSWMLWSALAWQSGDTFVSVPVRERWRNAGRWISRVSKRLVELALTSCAKRGVRRLAALRASVCGSSAIPQPVSSAIPQPVSSAIPHPVSSAIPQPVSSASRSASVDIPLHWTSTISGSVTPIATTIRTNISAKNGFHEHPHAQVETFSPLSGEVIAKQLQPVHASLVNVHTSLVNGHTSLVNVTLLSRRAPTLHFPSSVVSDTYLSVAPPSRSSTSGMASPESRFDPSRAWLVSSSSSSLPRRTPIVSTGSLDTHIEQTSLTNATARKRKSTSRSTSSGRQSIPTGGVFDLRSRKVARLDFIPANDAQ